MASANGDLKPAEAAAIAGRCEKTVLRWIAAGTLPAKKVLGRLVIKRADLEKLMKAEPRSIAASRS
jgi:excisionase family DNA binding protein